MQRPRPASALPPTSPPSPAASMPHHLSTRPSAASVPLLPPARVLITQTPRPGPRDPLCPGPHSSVQSYPLYLPCLCLTPRYSHISPQQDSATPNFCFLQGLRLKGNLPLKVALITWNVSFLLLRNYHSASPSVVCRLLGPLRPSQGVCKFKIIFIITLHVICLSFSQDICTDGARQWWAGLPAS